MQEADQEIHTQTQQNCVLFLLLPLDEHQNLLNEEMCQLVKSAHYSISKEYYLKPNKSDYLFSLHRLQEIQFEILSSSKTPDPIIVIGLHISPKQHINIEKFFELKVIDKFELVLEIFARRAKTEEAKLQIELAELKYERPREKLRLMHKLGIEGAWHTERTGFWGTGENPLNLFDARMTKRESLLRKKLTSLKNQREERRYNRKRYHHDSLYVSIVGYTSAGKSTLLNSLTNSHSSRVSSRLFETLDTKIRSFKLEDLKVFVTDTVGFIEDLPTFLIDSFKSTLEESLAADIVLIVIDGSEQPEYILQKTHVSIQTINEITPQNYQVLVLNKIDLLTTEALEVRLKLLKEHFFELFTVSISAKEDISPLIAIFDSFRPKQRYKCSYPPNFKFRAFCYDFAQVEKESLEYNDWQMVLSLRKPLYGIEILKHRAKSLGVRLKLEAI
ncbi:MAG: GTPase HflX [Candidatus Hodarchaeales archaeon]